MNDDQNTTRYIGQNIRALRINSGYSLKVAAGRLGISTSSLSKIENGAIDVNLSRLEQIANFYGVHLVELWTLNLENREIHESNLNIARKKVSDLESEIAGFQKKIILLYEKLRDQSVDFAAHA